MQRVVLSQAGAAPDGSEDLILGTLSATADISGSPTLALQAVDGVAGGVQSILEHHCCKLFFLHMIWLGCFRKPCVGQATSASVLIAGIQL